MIPPPVHRSLTSSTHLGPLKSSSATLSPVLDHKEKTYVSTSMTMIISWCRLDGVHDEGVFSSSSLPDVPRHSRIARDRRHPSMSVLNEARVGPRQRACLGGRTCDTVSTNPRRNRHRLVLLQDLTKKPFSIMPHTKCLEGILPSGKMSDSMCNTLNTTRAPYSVQRFSICQ